MERMTRLPSVLIAFVLCIAVTAAVASDAEAAVLKFDPTSVTKNADETFDVDIIVDAEEEQISGTDAYIIFDSEIVEAQSVEAGTFFPAVNNSIETDQVYINGVVTDSTDSKTGQGVLATVTFRMKSSQPGTMEFYCDLTQNDTSKIVKNDINATNVIECADLTLLSLNGGTTPSGATATPVPTSLPASGGTNPTAIPQQQTVIYQTGGQLPQSGVFDNVLKYSIPGAIFIVLGVVIKFLI
jgi:hypothetical protein